MTEKQVQVHEFSNLNIEKIEFLHRVVNTTLEKKGGGGCSTPGIRRFRKTKRLLASGMALGLKIWGGGGD